MRYNIIIVALLLFFSFILNATITIEQVNEFGYTDTAVGGGSGSDICTDSLYIYSLTRYGLIIQQVDESGSIELLSSLRIANPSYLKIDNNFAYITLQSENSDLYKNSIIKVDVSDRENPIIVQEREFVANSWISRILVFSDFIYYEYGQLVGNNMAFFLSKDDLSIIRQVAPLISPRKVSDTLMLERNNSQLYDVGNPENINTLFQFDFSPYHIAYAPHAFHVIQDTLMLAVSLNAISIWNISDLTDCEYLYDYQFEEPMQNFTDIDFYNENTIAYTTELGVYLIDITDIGNFNQINDIDISISCAYKISCLNSKILIFDRLFGGITILEYIDNELIYTDCIPYRKIYSSFICENYLFICYTSGENLVYDISNPYNPIECGNLFEGDQLYRNSHRENIFCYFNQELILKIYDISNLLEPQLLSCIDLNTYSNNQISSFSYIITSNFLFIHDKVMNDLVKYDIFSGEEIAVFQLPINSKKINIFNCNGYLTVARNNVIDLYLYENIIDNDLNNLHITENFSNNTRSDYISESGEFIQLSGIMGDDLFYSIDDAVNPEYKFMIEIDSEGYSSGIAVVYKNHLFKNLVTKFNIFEYDDNSTGILENIFSFNCGSFGGLPILSYNVNDQDYLIAPRQQCIEVYEADITVDNEDNIIVNKTPLLSNYPNPFSNSANSRNSGTNISFTIEKRSDVEISVYNTKGQKVKTLTNENYDAGEHSVFWNGKNESNKKVASGVYLYRMNVDGRVVQTNKCLVVK
jgi:hypothetical protein